MWHFLGVGNTWYLSSSFTDPRYAVTLQKSSQARFIPAVKSYFINCLNNSNSRELPTGSSWDHLVSKQKSFLLPRRSCVTTTAGMGYSSPTWDLAEERNEGFHCQRNERAISSTSSCRDLRPILSALQKATRKLQSVQTFLVIISSQHVFSGLQKNNEYFQFNCIAEIQDRLVLVNNDF